MDCTGSMSSYIEAATKNIRSIVEEIVVSEKSDVRLALVEYRDHPPQDSTFVTRVHNFTSKVKEMKGWLEQCKADGGGDEPEAVADALQDILKLSWRPEATKICILISDAPPHGLDPSGDGFPNGCPVGLDPIRIVREMAEKNITLYTVGVEPPIVPYRDFFMALAYITGGQYVPMVNAKLLAQVIIGGVREEISLDRLMQGAQEDIVRAMDQAHTDGLDETETAARIRHTLASKKMHAHRMKNKAGVTSKEAEEYYSKCVDIFKNTWIELIFKPISKLILYCWPYSPKYVVNGISSMCVFLFSGIVHEYYTYVAFSKFSGNQIIFFLLQGLAVCIEYILKRQFHQIYIPKSISFLLTFIFNGITAGYFMQPWISYFVKRQAFKYSLMNLIIRILSDKY
ncbi:unnamed protein product [Rotaria sp. Silwood1]|nr:unnamed protein product [Rotaria sp. Silwood1]